MAAQDLSQELGGRVALVTGGGRGLGRAYARALAQVGMIVAVTSRTETELQETVKLIEQAGGRDKKLYRLRLRRFDDM